MKKKRDAAYYRARLAKEFPAIFAEIGPGGLSVRAASAKAGLIHLPTRVDALKREWRRTTLREHGEFARWARVHEAKTRGTVARPIADKDGHLRLDVAKFLSDWVKANRSKPGRILKELGRSVHDWRLAHAIYHGGVLTKEVIDKLGPWLAKNGFGR